MISSKYVSVFLTAINQESISSRNQKIDETSLELNLSNHGSNLKNIVVKNRNENLNIKNHKPLEFIELIKPTRGALISLSFALDKIPDNTPILIIPTNSWVNFDSQKFVNEMFNSENEIGIVCFKSNNSKFSFLRKKGEQVLEFKEKEIISDLATTGVFYFANKIAISNCIEWCLLNNINKNGIYYLAPSLNYFVCQDAKIGIREIDASKYHRIDNESDIQIIKKESINENI
jgi:hypothetical protein